MGWVIEKNLSVSYRCRYGPELKSTTRLDPFEFGCVVEDSGDGIAVVRMAVGPGKGIPGLKQFMQEFKNLGFTELRGERIIRVKLT